ncbi:hypothetical protein ACIHFD_62715 [Nonomuraea sp. NPDC051941]
MRALLFAAFDESRKKRGIHSKPSGNSNSNITVCNRGEAMRKVIILTVAVAAAAALTMAGLAVLRGDSRSAKAR